MGRACYDASMNSVVGSSVPTDVMTPRATTREVSLFRLYTVVGPAAAANGTWNGIESEGVSWWTWRGSNPVVLLIPRNLQILRNARNAKNAQNASLRYTAGTRKEPRSERHDLVGVAPLS